MATSLMDSLNYHDRNIQVCVCVLGPDSLNEIRNIVT